ncbi:AMP-binding protein [Marinoscillum furvescens]|uniref:O-succinylbenzoic acid--CoA ligase n=1 Tax=Marinoscillum furvescens DSM 4134 TaxID=1122208 RepID=A0A3D9KZP6_MARFU|nr:AMP-binding protein [Marinoscillum furvescens]RED93884.1 O-succinylbenzoic acid--CoA ligase [Marinoscillum furvescens DSM 4134]
MTVTFSKNTFTFNELANLQLRELSLEKHEMQVAIIIQQWLQGADYLSIETSGSTGVPKNIKLSREVLAYSAKSSLAFLDSSQQFEQALLMLDAGKIGGMMVVIRSLISNMRLTVLKPGSSLAALPNDKKIDLVSLVPLQLMKLLKNEPHRFKQFNTVLIGGAPLTSSEREIIARLPCKIYHTYGMTETASHVALRNLSEQELVYKSIGDVTFRTDDRGCLALKGSVTSQRWIQTNDIVELNGDTAFVWKGRADFVINSGGLKVHPESLEELISDQLKKPFFVAGIPDERLGERVVLLVEGDKPTLDFSHIDKYQRPKAVYALDQFAYTTSGKINRLETLKKIKL